jgi:hypothetical protein
MIKHLFGSYEESFEKLSMLLAIKELNPKIVVLSQNEISMIV